jgi:hypothetical protein
MISAWLFWVIQRRSYIVISNSGSALCLYFLGGAEGKSQAINPAFMSAVGGSLLST